MPTGLPATFSRRALFALAGGGALAAALAACAPGGGSAAPVPTASGSWAPPAEPIVFPKGFVWGAATSAYQVEGSVSADGRAPSVWDTFAAKPRAIRDGSTGDPAADQYVRYADDIDLMAGLGLGAYRFSLSWSRIQPSGSGAVNLAALDHYRRVVDTLLDKGIRPAITLFHWDLPQALQDVGGWAKRDTALRFADYAEICFDALGDVEADWMTLNEPKTHAYVGHWYGSHAPGLRNPDLAVAAVHHQLLGHGLAVQRFRESRAKGRIGIALNLVSAYPLAQETEGLERVDARENRFFLDPVLRGTYPDEAIGGLPGQIPARPAAFMLLQEDGDLETISEPTDFLAVQYYGVTGVDATGAEGSVAPTSAARWQQIRAEGLYDLLLRLVRDYPAIPLLITENGIPDPTPELTVDDPHRIDFFRTHFQQAARAIWDGAPLEAYYVWSLLDNFEWAEGYRQRWGIIAVDFETQERTPKRSAEWYAGVIEANAVAAT
ncbi:GH1 family beta-glucosidase [Microbacterium sp. SS28]|uniref:GH1 family beta-glucosidase n=1 Tax=Microbacterium sp. SS28 TaxID=2919948 RepID=UPI001FA9E2F4|nr:GH1 family beta-glucosidase [Microbacterium sp. SS28]